MDERTLVETEQLAVHREESDEGVVRHQLGDVCGELLLQGFDLTNNGIED